MTNTPDPVRSPSTEPAPIPHSEHRHASHEWKADICRMGGVMDYDADATRPCTNPAEPAPTPESEAPNLYDALEAFKGAIPLEAEGSPSEAERLASRCAERARHNRQNPAYDGIPRTSIDEDAALFELAAEGLRSQARELEDAKRPIPREGERIVLTWLDAMHAKYPASEYGMVAVLVRSLSRQLEEARTENERLKIALGKYGRHTRFCNAVITQLGCDCKWPECRAELLEVSG